jgi:outer membrane protein OmpA-like peptidoglycan-associated protein
MSEKKRVKRKALANAIGVSVAIGAALFATALTLSGSPAGSGDKVKVQSPVVKDWAKMASAALAQAGYTGLVASVEDGILRITGDVTDAPARDRAFEVGTKAVLDDSDHMGEILAFENAITVAGQTIVSVPDAASALGAAPQAEACQTAYNTLLNGRVINFGSGSAVIDDASKPLLDALAAVAVRCGTYRVEIGGHTDSSGDETANQALSERRAQSVADYLVSKSVPATQLGVVGYGETDPVDPSGSEAADAENRRIAFKVMQSEN